jgi:hemerythrin superfamily protein
MVSKGAIMRTFSNSLAITDDRPLELLYACHEKVRRFSTLAGQLATHIHQQGMSEDVCQVATGILRYFELALPNHHADEEEDVFPALRTLNDFQLDKAIGAILAEHITLDSMWQEVRPWLKRIAGNEPPSATPTVLPRFISAYLAHVESEEHAIYPALERLPLDVINEIALNMRKRRGA